MEANYTEFDTVPAYEQAKWDVNGGAEPLNKGPVLWGGKIPPPAVGTEIKVPMNDLGPGTVVGYFTEYSWLGLLVRLHNPPLWWKKQNPTLPNAHIFGIEFRLVD